MRVFTCLIHDHSLGLVALAALMCVVGSYVTTRLIQRTVEGTGPDRLYWCFMSAVTAGAAIWATHFIAMLGYTPPVPVTFDGPLTIVSALIAVVGTAIGLLLAVSASRRDAVWFGGATIGLAIAATHYVGMFAYRVDGIVNWLPGYVAASVALSMILTALAIRELVAGRRRVPVAAAILSIAIIAPHFTGMAAFVVTPIPGVQAGADSEAFSAMASAIALVAFLIVGAGISTHLLDRRSREHSDRKLHHIAMHDHLTSIANRRAFSDALDKECRRLKSFHRPFALLMIDLDRFKPINDTLGHPVGDKVLRRVAGRLHAAIREGDVVARLGGDEFAILACNVGDAEQTESLARRIVEVLARPFVVEGNVAEIGASVGICLAPDHGDDAETLMHRADVALYTAKKEGKSQYCRFQPALNEALQRRRLIEADLRRACMREEFNVVYQPITDAATGEYTGAEALLRWSCADRGNVSPAEFIPIAEDLGLVSRIGAGVLKQACADAAEWPERLSLAVNISPVQLLDPRLPQAVQRALDESGLDASRLELEITETALVGNDDVAMRTLVNLKELGVQISLDDFGTGYSSLSYLHRFPISRIKIDKSFVQRLPEDTNSMSIVRAIAQLGQSMNMKITAEGIETDAQMAFVSEQGCHNLQGFLISHPLGPTDFTALMGAETERPAA